MVKVRRIKDGDAPPPEEHRWVLVGESKEAISGVSDHGKGRTFYYPHGSEQAGIDAAVERAKAYAAKEGIGAIYVIERRG